MQNIGLSGYLQSEKYRFFTAGRIQRNLCFVGRGFQRGRRPLWQRKRGISIAVFILLFLCGEASNETGRFRGGGIQRGLGLPWHTILLARSSVLYLLRQGGGEGDLRRGSARAVRRPRTGGVCRASARKRRSF